MLHSFTIRINNRANRNQMMASQTMAKDNEPTEEQRKCLAAKADILRTLYDAKGTIADINKRLLDAGVPEKNIFGSRPPGAFCW